MRPYVHVNVAMSADGKLSTRERRQVRISGQSDFERVDRLRAETDAIMVGIGTILADDPSLTVKSVMLRKKRHDRGMDEHPMRVVVDSSARIPPDASVLLKGEGKRVIACSSRAPLDRIEALRQCATVIVAGSEEVDLKALLEGLGSMGVRRLMVEGGGTLIWGLISLHLVDEITCYIGNILIGGRDAPTLAEGEGYVREEEFPRLNLKEVLPTDDGLL
ncbi:MAG: 2,5-diamino-6-(ribosylamino)-4(3H)-pyrimidinone 5'-phosphate reductase, partial [Methanoregulaceae archaeon]|nr:2,5-diamino-6-(ribosylamino)-4(3H)-pyrimidinone 5'-phosphate reductase [Methanoregulaceae archaeon]